MNNTTMPFSQRSPEYQQGWHDCRAHMEALEDERAIVGVLLGGEPEDNLSQRQYDRLLAIRVSRRPSDGEPAQ